MPEHSTPGTILLAGASRGLGLGLAAEYLARGWRVIATARGEAPGLAALAGKYPGALSVEALDVADAGSVRDLAGRLDRRLDVLFVVAGISTSSGVPVHQAAASDVALEFATNAVAPLALAEALGPHLAPGACVAFMTSILGSIGSNAGGGMELYRGTKAALNMFASCYALRHKGRPVLLLHPGWVRTELGGDNAPVDVETSARGLADMVAEYGAHAGISYLDYQGSRLPW